MQVVDGVKLCCHYFLGYIQMAQVCPGVVSTGVTAASFIHRLRVIIIPGILYYKSAFGSKEHSVSGISGGHDAIKHINTAIDTLNQIFRSTYPHNIFGIIFRQKGSCFGGEVIHHFTRLTNTQAAQSIAVKAD